MGCDYRSNVCDFENDIFRAFSAGHEILTVEQASELISEVFDSYEMAAPKLVLVPGFRDPQIGGFADIKGHRILIENGCTYRFLLLHECAHLLAPHDRVHGAIFLSYLLTLYMDYIDIPEAAVAELAGRHSLPFRMPVPVFHSTFSRFSLEP